MFDAYSKKIKKELNKQFINNCISIKHINCIINTNKHILNKNIFNKKNYKLNQSIQEFIINNINNNNCLTVDEILNLIEIKFNIKISLTTIYNFLRKKNYVYKKTKININPYSFGDQKQQLINFYNHLVNKDNSITLDIIKKKTADLFNNENTLLKRNDIINSTFIIERKNNILKMNNILKQEIEIINYEGIISIDEMSIITNRTCEKGWALKNNECIINIPFLKPNERYSLLMATSKKK